MMRRRKTKVYLDDVKNLLLDRKAKVNDDFRLYASMCSGYDISPDERITIAVNVLNEQLDSLLKEVDKFEVS